MVKNSPSFQSKSFSFRNPVIPGGRRVINNIVFKICIKFLTFMKSSLLQDDFYIIIKQIDITFKESKS